MLRMVVFILCLCLLVLGYTGAGGSLGPPTCVGGREGGGRCRPFLFSTENSQMVAYCLPVGGRGGTRVCAACHRLRDRPLGELVTTPQGNQAQNGTPACKMLQVRNIYLKNASSELG